MSRIEHIEGARWARETCEQTGLLYSGRDGAERLVAMLERGTKGKPAGYSNGVREIIELVRGIRL